jgi:hypothetical protein
LSSIKKGGRLEESAGVKAGVSKLSFEPMTLQDLSTELAAVEDLKVQWRLVMEFLEEFRHEPASTKLRLIASEPILTHTRWDGFLAGLAEHLAGVSELPKPGWVDDPCRCLSETWFTNPLATAQRRAVEDSPAAFRSRNIFLEPHDLEVA